MERPNTFPPWLESTYAYAPTLPSLYIDVPQVDGVANMQDILDEIDQCLQSLVCTYVVKMESVKDTKDELTLCFQAAIDEILTILNKTYLKLSVDISTQVWPEFCLRFDALLIQVYTRYRDLLGEVKADDDLFFDMMNANNNFVEVCLLRNDSGKYFANPSKVIDNFRSILPHVMYGILAEVSVARAAASTFKGIPDVKVESASPEDNAFKGYDIKIEFPLVQCFIDIKSALIPSCVVFKKTPYGVFVLDITQLNITEKKLSKKEFFKYLETVKLPSNFVRFLRRANFNEPKPETVVEPQDNAEPQENAELYFISLRVRGCPDVVNTDSTNKTGNLKLPKKFQLLLKYFAKRFKIPA